MDPSTVSLLSDLNEFLTSDFTANAGIVFAIFSGNKKKPLNLSEIKGQQRELSLP
jgi:hypothetical protein